jgi:hypothetical protein
VAKVPNRAELTVSVEGGTVTFEITDDDRLESIDRSVSKWHPNELGPRLGMEVENVEVER